MNASVTSSQRYLQFNSPHQPQNSLFRVAVNKPCAGDQWLYATLPTIAGHVDVGVLRLSKASQRVSCAHRQRHPRSCTMCLKCAPGWRKMAACSSTFRRDGSFWHLCQWACSRRWSTQPWLHSTQVIVSRVLVHGLRIRAISSKHWRPCLCKLRRNAHIGTTHGSPSRGIFP